MFWKRTESKSNLEYRPSLGDPSEQKDVSPTQARVCLFHVGQNGNSHEDTKLSDTLPKMT